MGKVFRARFMEGLRKQFDHPAAFYDKLFAKDWVVYCKAPFYNTSQVVEYLGRYTHKIAISNHFIKDIVDRTVTFSAKDYRHGGKKSLLRLTDAEFIRRFCLHILPKGFVRIRHYGILSSSKKKRILPMLKLELGCPPLKIGTGPIHHRRCPSCKKGKLVTVLVFDCRGRQNIGPKR